MLSLHSKLSKKGLKTRSFSYEDMAILSLLVVGLVGLGVWVFRIVQNVNQPGIEYGEGLIVYLAKLYGSGQWHYSGLNGPPFQVSFYTPLFYFVMGKLGGTLVLGRLLDIGCAAVSMGLVFLIVYHLTKNKFVSLFAALIPATQYIFIQWSLILKTDLMAVMFELAGVYLVVRFWRSKWLYLSIPLFLLAFYSKQSFLMAAGAVIIALAVQKNWTRAIAYALAFGIPLFGSVGVLNYLTQGEFVRQIVTYQQTSPMFMPFLDYSQRALVSVWTLIPALIIGLFYAFKDSKNFLVFYAGLSLVFGILSLGRVGSSQIYMLESIFAVAILAGLGLPELIKKRQTIYIFIAVAVPLVTLFSRNLTYFSPPAYAEDYKAGEALIADANFPILTENAALVVDAGKTPYLCDPFVFWNLSSLGIWDETPLLNDLESNKIPYVVTQFKLPAVKIRRFDTKVEKAISDNYHVIMDVSQKYTYGFTIYKANKESK